VVIAFDKVKDGSREYIRIEETDKRVDLS